MQRDEVAEWLRTRSQIALTAKQADAVCSALTAKLTVLTGGPGTGKTTTVRGLIQLLKANNHTFHLAAPTGRAAKRLSEATGEPAQTLHRLLEFKPAAEAGARFLRDRDNPLDADLIIVDELSMIDLLLMNALLKAVAVNSHLLLVGDPDQLPSVGAGNVLKDPTPSRAGPGTARSTISPRSAPRPSPYKTPPINHRGEKPGFCPAAPNPSPSFKRGRAEGGGGGGVGVVTTSIPARFKLDPINDIQVLSPDAPRRGGRGAVQRGAAGRAQPAAARQARVEARRARVPRRRQGHPAAQQLRQGRLQRRHRPRHGDRPDDRHARGATSTARRVLTFERGEFGDLALAYAISIHKSQGSEYPVVIVPLLKAHFMMLQRNLLYTAITRAGRSLSFLPPTLPRPTKQTTPKPPGCAR